MTLLFFFLDYPYTHTQLYVYIYICFFLLILVCGPAFVLVMHLVTASELISLGHQSWIFLLL